MSMVSRFFSWDAAKAFVRVKMNHETYMRLPGGCGEISGKIVRLTRLIYGLEQSGRRWAGPLEEIVVEYGMKQCGTGQCAVRTVAQRRRTEYSR